ncbi:ImpA family type VI secretion-associated protein [Escherichia coli]|uniref:ImpA family type VI secretion-associated protein n=1 Tax=Escherichia coli TaxID=562 RepID=A0A376L057_ECOLX|nr:ImpA family type VI secretion-associated protein [Escherichia coli]
MSFVSSTVRLITISCARMAAEEGIFFYEEHAQKSTDQSLVLCDTVRYLPGVL